jgi:hypothetical protein
MVFPTRDPANDRRNSTDIAFIVWAAIVAVGMIVVSYALGVAFDPALAIFAAP